MTFHTIKIIERRLVQTTRGWREHFVIDARVWCTNIDADGVFIYLNLEIGNELFRLRTGESREEIVHETPYASPIACHVLVDELGSGNIRPVALRFGENGEFIRLFPAHSNPVIAQDRRNAEEHILVTSSPHRP
jgi:hypothetical protein